jgi:plasmid stabilization system protein ParE
MATRYRVIISPDAFADLERILDYVAQSSPANAVRLIDHLLAEAESLEQFPRRYSRANADPSYGELRSMPSPPFRIIYEVNDAQRTVRVLAVPHGAQQDWP